MPSKSAACRSFSVLVMLAVPASVDATSSSTGSEQDALAAVSFWASVCIGTDHDEVRLLDASCAWAESGVCENAKMVGLTVLLVGTLIFRMRPLMRISFGQSGSRVVISPAVAPNMCNADLQMAFGNRTTNVGRKETTGVQGSVQ